MYRDGVKQLILGELVDQTVEAEPDGLPQASLHQRILSDIQAKILSGEWPPGYRIPFEHALTEQYGCSRMTVNKALTQLAKAGLIERRRKSGSFVKRPQSQAAILEIHDIATEVAALELPYRFELLERRIRKSGEDERVFVGSGRAQPLLELTCLHYAGERPFCLEDRLINLDAVPQAVEADFAAHAPGAWLIREVPWSAAENNIRAVNADRVTARSLDIAKGAACLVVERRTWIGGQPITQVRLTYSGDSHALVARFAPSDR